MATTTSLNPSSANKLVLEAFGAGFDSYEPQGQKIFTDKTPERVDEKFSVHASGASLQEVAEGASYPSANVEEAGSVTASQRVFKREIGLTKLGKRFANYGTVIEEMGKLGYLASIKRDEVKAEILNGVESTSLCWDGLSLANASHLIGNTGLTQSNIVSGALSKSTLNEAYTNLQNQKDHNNQPQPIRASQLVVAPALAMTAFELLGSPSDPETADRSINFINALNMELCVWNLLSSTADAHVLAPKMFHRLRYLESIPTEVTIITDQDTGNLVYQVDLACEATAPDYLGYQFINAA